MGTSNSTVPTFYNKIQYSLQPSHWSFTITFLFVQVWYDLTVGNRVIEPGFTKCNNIGFAGGSIGSEGFNIQNKTAAIGIDDLEERG